MKILISGISGYLGSLISRELEQRNHETIGISRTELYGPIAKLAEKIKGAEIIINLAGATILQRWTSKNKKIIYKSRVVTTKNLVLAIKSLPEKYQPKKFISSSAIGIYKSGFLHDENSTNFDDGFLGNVVINWEKQLDDLPLNIQKVIFRTGIVLGRKSKTITNLLLPFKLGLGATIGNGQQPFPFVHETDVVDAYILAIENSISSGIYNLVAPEKVNNKTFTKELAQKLNRPAFLSVPEIFLKLIFGNASILLIESPEVSSEKIIKEGFEFHYPDIKSVLGEILLK